jgi:secreted Zn-dependent insulinase-like peptidase
MISSVLVNLEAKDKNLSEENQRLIASEVGQHRYMFDRQQRECEVIKAITKAEW